VALKELLKELLQVIRRNDQLTTSCASMIDASVNVKILGEELRGATIDLARSRYVDYVSHGSSLTNCRVIIHGLARGIVFHAATLTDCEIVVKRRFTGYDWGDVTLKRCRFVGEFDHCQFGPRSTVYPARPRGAIEDCDFSGARLGWCEFYNCDLAGIVFPGWPTFVVSSPRENADEWMRIPFPDSYAAVEQKMMCGLFPEMDLTGLGAVTQDAAVLAKTHGISTEAVQRLIAGHHFISCREAGGK
jgi:hypothetical protein